MLTNEAIWLGKQSEKIDLERLSPLLNLGSQSAVFQKQTPWIENFFLGPLKARGIKVINTDLQDAPGVDLVGDLLDPTFNQKIAQLGCRSVICCNLLEHVLNKEAVAKAITEAIPPGGYIFASCPKKFPHHPDPIDNGYRPTPAELAEIFPDTIMIEGEVVLCETGWEYLRHGPRNPILKIARIALPFVKPRGWVQTMRNLSWSTRRFAATCVILKKHCLKP